MQLVTLYTGKWASFFSDSNTHSLCLGDKVRTCSVLYSDVGVTAINISRPTGRNLMMVMSSGKSSGPCTIIFLGGIESSGHQAQNRQVIKHMEVYFPMNSSDCVLEISMAIQPLKNSSCHEKSQRTLRKQTLK